MQTINIRVTVTLNTPRYPLTSGEFHLDLRWFDYLKQWEQPQTLAVSNVANTWAYRPPVA